MIPLWYFVTRGFRIFTRWSGRPLNRRSCKAAMNQQPRHIYEFGPFRLDATEHLLLRDGEAVPLTPKAFDLLLALVERHGHLLEKDELLKKVWPDTFVEEANLSSNISQLRKALGDGENGHRYIETVPKRGYRFVASVRDMTDGGEQFISSPKSKAPEVIQESTPATSRSEETPVPTVVSAEGRQSKIGRQKRSLMMTIVALIVVGAGSVFIATVVRQRYQAIQPASHTLLRLTFD